MGPEQCNISWSRSHFSFLNLLHTKACLRLQTIWSLFSLDDKNDCALWCICVPAVCRTKGMYDVVEKANKAGATAEGNLVSEDEATTESKEASGRSKPVSESMHKNGSNALVITPGDQALRVIQTVIWKPCEMVDKLHARYEFKPTNRKILHMVELVLKKYLPFLDNMLNHIDKLASGVRQLSTLNTSLPNTSAVEIIVARSESPCWCLHQNHPRLKPKKTPTGSRSQAALSKRRQRC